jgi:cell pole-organizing protein PopZ
MTRDIGEPSLEEILASIKKVIAEDNRKPRRAPQQRPAPAPARQAAPVDDILELTDSVEPEPAAEPEEAPLISRAGEQSMRESLAVLATLTEPGVSPQIVRSGETSLEGMVRAMLRPMLAEWLDKNLPPIVEAMVAKEIGRITGRKG